MNVALVISSMSLGGASRVMSLLANYWAERGDGVILITLDCLAMDAFALHPNVRRIGFDLMRDSSGVSSAIVNNYQRVRALRGAIARSRADVVLSFEDRTNVLVLIAAIGLGIRRVICERTDVTRHRIGRLWPVLRRLTYPMAAALTVQSRALLPWASSVMLGGRRVRVVPNPVVVENFTCRARPRHARTIVSIGRLEPEKGYDILLRAFASIAREFAEWDLLIAGDGSQRAALESLAAALGIDRRVRFVGYIADPATVLRDAAMFVMSSRYEGFPNALLEAMAASVPVISTACVGSLELVSDGSTGVLVPVENPEALAAAMRRLMLDHGLRETLARNAAAAARRYSVETVMREWDAVIAPLCLRSSS